MLVDTSQPLSALDRHIPQVVERLGVVETAESAIVVVARYAMVATSVDVDRWQGITHTWLALASPRVRVHLIVVIVHVAVDMRAKCLSRINQSSFQKRSKMQ